MERRSVYRRSSAAGLASPSARSRSAERSLAMDDFEQALQAGGSDEENLVSEQVPESPMASNGHVPSIDGSSRHSESKRKSHHRRAMSDPFDTADSEGMIEELAKEMADPEEAQALPTLPRYPYAETNNKNCWSETPNIVFSVRGESYLKTKKKVTSGEYLLRARGCDLFLSEKPNEIEMSRLHGAMGGHLRQVPSLLIRLTFPWGMLIQYYEVPAKLLPFLRGETSSPMDHLAKEEKTFARWFLGDDKYKTDRLKLIPHVVEGPWIVRNLVAGTPTIIGKKLPIKYQYVPKEGSRCDFFECNLDVGNSTKAAKKIVSVCRRYMTALTVDVGFVIEGKTPDELPERMMGAVRIHKIDSEKAPTVHPN